MVWLKQWESSKPPDTGESPTLGAGRIRDIKTEVTERLPFMYGFDLADGEADNTKKGAKWLPLNKQTTKPTAVTDQLMFYTKQVGSLLELFIERPDGTEIQLSNGGGLNESIKSSMIVMWYGTIATIPSGWVLCDGLNSTPDLRDKFVVGAKQDDAGVAKTNITGALTQSGGTISHNHGGATESHVLTIAEIPSHTHSHTAYQVSGAAGSNWGHTETTNNPTTLTIDATGGGGGHTHTIASETHIPPYFALAFIKKT